MRKKVTVRIGNKNIAQFEKILDNINMKLTMPQGREFTIEKCDIGFKLTDEDGFVLYPKDLSEFDRIYVKMCIDIAEAVEKHLPEES